MFQGISWAKDIAKNITLGQDFDFGALKLKEWFEVIAHDNYVHLQQYIDK